MTHSDEQTGQAASISYARHHPAVRRGTRLLRGQWISLALVLLALGIAVLIRDLTEVPTLAASACFVGAGLSLWVGRLMINSLRHEYRYQDHHEDHHDSEGLTSQGKS